jgi:glycosyltransferase involved in cell wall biosynthesis
MSIDPAARSQPTAAGRPATAGSSPYVSVIVPLFNEVENTPLLYDELRRVLDDLGKPWELVLVDDGSSDGTTDVLRRLSGDDPRVRTVIFRRNFGQTAALSAGFDHARGEILVPMDGDLQNDPGDIPSLVALVEQGYDVVSGWRRRRKDPFLTRRLPSIAANWIIGRLTKVKIHDYGCTLKAYRHDVIRNVKLYGEMHRFIPVYASWVGAKVLEVEVNHRPRTHGSSKYGLFRVFKVVLDLITVKFLGSYGTSPIYAFGGAGLILCFLGTLAGAETLWEKLFYDTPVHRNPVILLAVFLFLLGTQAILIGLLAEISIRTYYESQNKPTYFVREVLGGGEEEDEDGRVSPTS